MRNKIKVLIVIVFLLATCSCAVTSKTSTSQADSTRVEYRYMHDTLITHERDSVFVNQYTKGDTVYRDRVRDRIRYKDRIVYQKDTIVNNKVKLQTVKQDVVKKVVPKWCWYLLTANVIVAAFFALKTYLKWKKI